MRKSLADCSAYIGPYNIILLFLNAALRKNDKISDSVSYTAVYRRHTFASVTDGFSSYTRKPILYARGIIVEFISETLNARTANQITVREIFYSRCRTSRETARVTIYRTRRCRTTKRGVGRITAYVCYTQVGRLQAPVESYGARGGRTQ